MAKKNIKVEYNNVPETLSDHPFYGLILDDEQAKFRDAIWSDNTPIVFCNANSGTGKTTIATGVADLLVKYGKYDGIVYIAAPVQEAKQGFLPGSIDDKSEPYFEPFYQALNKIGVNINTASPSILKFVSGMTKTMIDKIYAISGIGASSVDDMIRRKYESNDNGIIYNEARFYKDAVSEAMAAGTADIDEYSEDGSSVISDDSAYNQAIAWMKENGIREVDKNGEESNISVDICYTLNSGKIVIKRYDIPISKIYSAMNEVYKTEEFKKDHFDIYNVMEKDAIGKVEVYDVYENRIISLTDNEKNTFLSMYLKDLSKMTADTISQIPVGRMAPYIKISNLYDEALSGYYIYPEFTNTLSYIESLGASTDTFTTKIDKNRIETVSVSSYNLYEYENGESIYVDEIYYSKEKEPEVIDKLADNFEISENIWSNEKLIRYKMGIGDSDTNTMVYLGNDNGIQRSISVLFKDGRMPDRIKKDVAIKIWNDNQF